MVKWSGEIVRLPPLFRKGEAPKDRDVCGVADIPNESLLIDRKTLGVANVFIYLPQAPAGFKEESPLQPLVLNIRNCRLVPHCSTSRIGQPLEVRSEDGIAHNPHWNLSVNDRFHRVIQPAQVHKEMFTRVERLPVRIVCDLHPWIQGYQTLLNHPFSAITDATGTFAITNLPAGTHEFIVWHERGGYLIKKLSIKIRPDETTAQDLEVNAKQFAGEQ